MPESERLLYRPLLPADADAVYALTSDPAVARFMRFDTHTERRQAVELIDAYTRAGGTAFRLCAKENDETVGVFALKPCGEDAYSLSAFLAPVYWRAGFASEATVCMCAYAFTQMGACRLEGYVVASHGASCRVLEKTGFRLVETRTFDDLPEGLRLYRLEVEDWKEAGRYGDRCAHPISR